MADNVEQGQPFSLFIYTLSPYNSYSQYLFLPYDKYHISLKAKLIKSL